MKQRSHRYFEDFCRDSPAICRPRAGFLHKSNFETVLPALKTTADCNFPVSIQFEQRTTRYCVFGCVGSLIQSGSGYIESCLTAQKRFMLLKGSGSFYIFFLNLRKCRELKDYRLILLKPPPPPPSLAILQSL